LSHKRFSRANLRAITATHAGCVQRGLGKKTPGAKHGSRYAAEDDQRPSIL